MKKLIVVFSICVGSFILYSFTSSDRTAKDADIFADESTMDVTIGMKLIVNEESWPIPTDEASQYSIRFCPGSGCGCKGTVKVDGHVYSYDGSKGCLRPDVIIAN